MSLSFVKTFSHTALSPVRTQVEVVPNSRFLGPSGVPSSPPRTLTVQSQHRLHRLSPMKVLGPQEPPATGPGHLRSAGRPQSRVPVAPPGALLSQDSSLEAL